MAWVNASFGAFPNDNAQQASISIDGDGDDFFSAGVDPGSSDGDTWHICTDADPSEDDKFHEVFNDTIAADSLEEDSWYTSDDMLMGTQGSLLPVVTSFPNETGSPSVPQMVPQQQWLGHTLYDDTSAFETEDSMETSGGDAVARSTPVPFCSTAVSRRHHPQAQALNLSAVRIPDDDEISWDGEDETDELLELIESRLAPFTKQFGPSASAYVTPPISTRQRRAVKAIAHYKGLSHLTLDRGRPLRRVLIAYSCMVWRTPLADTYKCWNNLKAHSTVDVMTLEIVVREAVSFAWLLHIPQELVQLTVSMDWMEAQPNCNETCFGLGFGTPEHAVYALNYLEQLFKDVDFSGKPLVNYRTAFKVPSIPALEWERYAQIWSNLTRHCPAETNASSKSGESSTRSGLTHCSEKPNHKRITFCSGTSREGSAAPDSRVGESSEPRRRYPRIEQGYVCRADGCQKAFNYHGERTKHEHNHSPGVWPFACSECGKPFQWENHLVRHKKSRKCAWSLRERRRRAYWDDADEGIGPSRLESRSRPAKSSRR